MSASDVNPRIDISPPKKLAVDDDSRTKAPASNSCSLDLWNKDDVQRKDCLFYMQRYKAEQQKTKHLDSVLRRLWSLYDDLGGVPEKLVKLTDEVVRENATLTRRMEERREMRTLLVNQDLESPSSAHTQIVNCFRKMKDEISALGIYRGSTMPHIRPFFGVTADMDLLLATLGLEITSQTGEMDYDVPSVSTAELIRAFTGAAIHQWVFSLPFRCHSMTTTPLLEEYRDCLGILRAYLYHPLTYEASADLW
jgi:hypothetical protein